MAFKVVARPALPSTLAGEVLTRLGAQRVEVPLFTEGDIIKNAADADAVLVGPTEPFTQDVIRTLSKCKILSRTGGGANDRIQKRVLPGNGARENGAGPRRIAERQPSPHWFPRHGG